jgi:UDP-N-acetylglucosamine--N-acetylmuramyl-(pentapeptide) pyrophosphoryl-undecaprenol N-acetylglucosamine transferase
MNIIMTCGGTGGHIYPAIAIADAIMKHHPYANVVFIGTGRPLEQRAIGAAGYELRIIPASGFYRKRLHKNVKTLRDTVYGSRVAGKIIDELKPRVVVGTGGYVCVPVLMAASRKKIPAYLHEQNAIPGLANRWLEGRCQKVFLGFQEAAGYLRQEGKWVVTGNPVRQSMGSLSKQEAREQLGIEEQDFLLLAFGGSQGAGVLNQRILEILPWFLEKKAHRLSFITGSFYYPKIREQLFEEKLLDNPGLELLEYTDRMALLLSASDLVLSRAGALTIAEEMACGTPAILVPSPNVTGNHQYYNGKSVADKGGAVLVEEKDLTVDRLKEEIWALKTNEERRRSMAVAMRNMARPKAAEEIYRHLCLNGA